MINQDTNLLFWLIETVIQQTTELRMALRWFWTVLQLALLILAFGTSSSTLLL